MNKEELNIILSEGEGQFIEFKEKIDKNLSKEFVAFANSSGANIFVYIYDDRIEIINPGRLLPGITPKTFGKISLRRNEIIADIFSRTPYVEKIASGIKRIKNLCKEQKIKTKYNFDSFIELTFYRKSTLNDTFNDTLNDTLNDRILSILKINPYIKQNELAQKLKVSLITVKRTIKKLLDKKIINRVGSKKTGSWKILNSKK